MKVNLELPVEEVTKAVQEYLENKGYSVATEKIKPQVEEACEGYGMAETYSKKFTGYRITDAITPAS